MADKVDVLAVQASQSALALDAQTHLVRSLESAGWNLLAVEIDVGAETARIELRRGALSVIFDARNGRASITRELITAEPVRIGRKGDVTVVTRFKPVFIGRQSGLGLRSGLKSLAHYVADNAALQLSHEAARNIFRPLLNPPTTSILAGASQ